jgi:hypothetical protein
MHQQNNPPERTCIMPIDPCQTGDENPTAVIVTMFPNGDSVRLCAECLVPYLVNMLAATTGSDPEKIVAAISEPDEAERHVADAGLKPGEGLVPAPPRQGSSRRKPDPLPLMSSAPLMATDDEISAPDDETATVSSDSGPPP